MSEWIYLKDELPEPYVEVFVVREHSDKSLHTTKAHRRGEMPLTVQEDASRNCWWHDSNGCNFSDSTVIAWKKISPPAFNGVTLPEE